MIPESGISKIPNITLLFWITKICATTLGETAGDLLAQTMQVGYGTSTLILITFFLIALFTQLFMKEYHPAIYWLVILSTSTAGTTMSDYMDRTLEMGYALGSIFLIALLTLTLNIWRKTEKSISVSNIHSVRAETFYWMAILISNTLGTALGDFLADDSGLGFSGGALLIASMLLVIVLTYYFTKISTVLLFWIAFVLTRPFGATFGDLLTKPVSKGGLNFGTMGSSAFLFTILLILVIHEISIIQKRKKLQ